MIDISTLTVLDAAASDVANSLRSGDRVGLIGDLGAGKTTFVKCIARALGITDELISPTFVYHQQYNLPTTIRGIARLHHFDLYRLERDEDVVALGLDTHDEDGVSFIEWIEHAPKLQAAAQLLLTFTLDPDGTRQLSVERP